MTRVGRSIAAATMACAASVIVGCSTSTPSTPLAPPSVSATTATVPVGYQVPRNVMFSEHWVATPAVDLMSPEGTYLRAYTEADHVANHNTEMESGSYPGFANAARDRSFHWFGTGFPAKGFYTNWVPKLDVAPDGSVTAVVCCAGEVALDGAFPDSYGTFKQTLTFRRVGGSPPGNQKGPGRAPLVSVFGAWYTSRFTLDPLMDPACATDPPPVDKGPVSTPGWPDHPGV